jgi:hemin uptake protein HemP
MSEELPEAPQPTYTTPRQVTSEELLDGKKEVWIRHGEEIYRLRLTRSGKLILQK